MARHKQTVYPKVETLGGDLLNFFKNDVQKKHAKVGKVAEIWLQLIPITLVDHTCIESFTAGTLKVLVDSSSHLYELKTVLLAGLEKQILLAGKPHGLRKINMRLGRWYDGDDEQTRRVTF